MQGIIRTAAVAVAFLLLGCAACFYRLDWSASGDHTSTLMEVQSLLQKPFFLAEFEYHDGMPRLVPVAYALQALTLKVFGSSEAGSRAGSAVAGAMAIAVCVVLVSRLYGLPQAVILGVMLLLWPWLLGHSQSNRHYSYAFLFTSIASLTAGVSWHRNSLLWGAVAGAFSAIAISTHTISAVVPAGLLMFLVVEVATKRGPIPKRAISGYLWVGLPLIVASLGLAMWANGRSPPVRVGWGRSPDVTGLAYNLGWSVVLLSLLGWALAWWENIPAGRMWAAIAVVAALACVFVPFVSAFRADYLFPSALVFFLLASRVLTRVYEGLLTTARAVGLGVVASVVLFPLPSVVSYYRDGDRCDYRSAAGFIQGRLRPADIVAADTPGALGYYLDVPVYSVGRPSTTAPQTVEALSKLAADGKRVWYVCRFAREEPTPEVDRWFWKNAIRMLRIKRKRLDYHENILDVYLFHASATDQQAIEDEVPRAKGSF